MEELGDAWGTAAAVSSICRIRSIFGDYEGAQDVFEHGLVAAERAGDDLMVIMALTNLADYALAIGQPAASLEYIGRAFGLLDATGVRYAAPDLLEALAQIEADTGDRARASELLGTADALRAAMNVPLWGHRGGISSSRHHPSCVLSTERRCSAHKGSSATSEERHGPTAGVT